MKKKTSRLLMTVLLCLVMVLGMGIAAFAEGEGTYTITVTAKDASANHDFEAYKIFSGEVYEAEGEISLINIGWGDGVNSTGLVAALHAKYPAVFPNTSYSASEVADIISDSKVFTDAEGFADLVAQNLATKAGNGKTEIVVTGAGYYLIKDKDNSLNGDQSTVASAYTDFILKVVRDVEVTAKADVPSLDKKIVDGTTEKKANTASIGDVISFKITSTVPDMTGYKNYFFVVEDTLSQGLTFNGDVAITVEGFTETVPFEVEEGAKDGTTGDHKLTITMKNFWNLYKALKGKKITITYTATLNENAQVGNAGNPNTAQLIFSNNPNVDTTGDKPSSDSPVGKTPEVNTITYTTEIKIAKVDGKDATKALQGAKFKIEGEGVKVVVTNGKIFKKSATGTYYMLKNGTFTTQPGTAELDSNDKYELVDVVTKDTVNETINKVVSTDAGGFAYFKGLTAGTYTITELEAPEGYNKLLNPVTVTIGGDVNAETGACTWSVSATNASVQADGTILIQIGNNKGIHIPETGGIGTMLFYLVGAGLIVLAVTLIITKRRVRNQEF